MHRRTLLGAGALALLGGTLPARPSKPPATAPDGALPAPRSLPLWPGLPPDGAGPAGPEQQSAVGTLRAISQPRLHCYRPRRANGSTVLVIAGGGYVNVGLGGESTPAARWLQALGVTVYELVYRLPGEGWTPLAPLQDAQRAMRLIRVAAADEGLDPARVGILGFSAGGHLAGITATTPTLARYRPADAADTASSRPDFAALIYPVISMQAALGHTSSMRQLLGPRPDPRQADALSVERRVDPTTPPTFLVHAGDDPIVKVEHSLAMFGALRAARVAADLHIFQHGGHGFGLGPADAPVHAWPQLAERWMHQLGMLDG